VSGLIELRIWVDEAIKSLGYLKPEAALKLVNLIHDNRHQNSKQISTLYRKGGEQLTSEEKKHLGIRANAMMSKQAINDLTEKGLSKPVSAHEQTILRASLAWSRSNNMADGSGAGTSKWEVLAPFPDKCPGCKRLDGKFIFAGEMEPTGPHDCFREACAIALSVDVKDIVSFDAPLTSRAQQTTQKAPKPWWQFW
jgi:hypothetical protein